MAQTSDDVVVDVANQKLILIEEDGIKRGGVEFPEIRDSDCSVTLIMSPGTTHTTGLHWHEQKTGKHTLMRLPGPTVGHCHLT